MQYTVYLDAVFLTNLVMDYILLRLLKILLKCRTGRVRAFMGALLGAAGACLLLLLPQETPGFLKVLLHGCLAIGMVKIGCHAKSKSMLLQGIASLYFTAFLCGGFWEVLVGRREITWKLFLLLGALTYAVITTFALVRECYKIRIQNIYKVRLNYQGKVLQERGFYDTGNCLMDLESRKPVSIISWRALGQLVPPECLEQLKNYETQVKQWDRGTWEGLKPHFLPFQSVGNPAGLVLAVTLEEMCIETVDQTLWIHAPVVAIPKEEFLKEKEYQIILNAQVLDQREV